MKLSKKPSFNYEICMACGMCMQACPFSCIAMSKTDIDSYPKAYPVLTSVETCTGCGICSTSCPVDAIELEVLEAQV